MNLQSLVLIATILGSFVTASADVRPNCTASTPGEAPLTRDYKILTSKSEVDQYSTKYYESALRLKARAYWDPSLQSMVIPHGDGVIAAPTNFMEGLASHIKKAFENKYVDAVIYQDMGHAHLQMPENEWADIKKNIANSSARMEKVLASPNLKALYHTVEMVQIKEGDFAKGKMPQDPWKLWRYFSRNLLGSFDHHNSVEVVWAGPQAIYNTVRSVENMTEVSTLYFSANKDACLPYVENGQTKFFDMTFETIPYEAGN